MIKLFRRKHHLNQLPKFAINNTIPKDIRYQASDLHAVELPIKRAVKHIVLVNSNLR